MKRLTLEVLVLTILHMLVDGICAATIYASLYKDNLMLPIIVFVGYNVLAFMLQPLMGIMIDTYKKERLLVLGSLALVIMGALLGKIPYLCLLLLGLGNALFHTSAGKITIKSSNNKLSLLGIFVSLGVIGLTVGMLYSTSSILLVILIILTLITGGCFYFMNRRNKGFLFTEQIVTTHEMSFKNKNLLIILGIIVVVMFRGMIGKYTIFHWANQSYLILFVAIATALGKALGGIMADKVGIKATIIISGVGSLGLLLFARNTMIGGLLGILLFNMTMPITLYLLYKRMPKYEATAFGLAAMILFPGYVIGMYLQGYPVLYNLVISVATIVTIIFVIYSIKGVNENEVS